MVWQEMGEKGLEIDLKTLLENNLEASEQVDQFRVEMTGGTFMPLRRDRPTTDR